VNLEPEPRKFAPMSQLPLFSTQRGLPRQSDLAYVRKSLNRLLRVAREAQIMPWSADETHVWERQFPELAASLPAEEASELISEFNMELARLRSAE
jgi:hypothetical protein